MVVFCLFVGFVFVFFFSPCLSQNEKILNLKHLCEVCEEYWKVTIGAAFFSFFGLLLFCY